MKVTIAIDSMIENPYQHAEMAAFMKEHSIRWEADNGDCGAGWPELVFSGSYENMLKFLAAFYENGLTTEELFETVKIDNEPELPIYIIFEDRPGYENFFAVADHNNIDQVRAKLGFTLLPGKTQAIFPIKANEIYQRFLSRIYLKELSTEEQIRNILDI